MTYPSDWDERSIGDFVHVGRGASPRPIEAFLTSSVDGVNWIKIGDAPRYGKYITQTAEKITQSGVARSVRVNVGDFILSNSMSFGRPYILNIGGCIHDGWLRLYDYQDSVDKEFLYYLLSSEDTKKQYATFAAGSGVQNLNKTVVKKVVVHLPSIPEQRRIARALSEMDDHIDNLAELIEKKKAIRDGALEDLINCRKRLKGFKKDWIRTFFAQFTTLMVDGPFGSDLKTEHYTLNHEARVIQLSNIGENGWNDANIKYTTFAHAAELSRCITKPGELLIAKMMPAGRAILCPCGENMYIISSDVVRVIVNSNVDSRFVVYCTKGEFYLNQIAENTQGSTRQRTSIRKLKKIQLMLPEYEEQKAIANVLTAMDDEIRALEDERDKMMQIREGAMDDLLTGRVRLTV